MWREVKTFREQGGDVLPLSDYKRRLLEELIAGFDDDIQQVRMMIADEIRYAHVLHTDPVMADRHMHNLHEDVQYLETQQRMLRDHLYIHDEGHWPQDVEEDSE